MRRYITTPEDDIGLNLLVDNVPHGGYNVNGDIAAEGAKGTGLKCGILGEAVGSAAADHIGALLGGTSAVLQIHVDISEVHKLQSGSLLALEISSDLLIQVIDEIIILDDVRLG